MSGDGALRVAAASPRAPPLFAAATDWLFRVACQPKRTTVVPQQTPRMTPAISSQRGMRLRGTGPPASGSSRFAEEVKSDMRTGGLLLRLLQFIRRILTRKLGLRSCLENGKPLQFGQSVFRAVAFILPDVIVSAQERVAIADRRFQSVQAGRQSAGPQRKPIRGRALPTRPVRPTRSVDRPVGTERTCARGHDPRLARFAKEIGLEDDVCRNADYGGESHGGQESPAACSCFPVKLRGAALLQIGEDGRECALYFGGIAGTSRGSLVEQVVDRA